jgi:hypothetical protein
MIENRGYPLHLVTGSSGLIGSEHLDRQGTSAQPYCLEANSGLWLMRICGSLSPEFLPQAATPQNIPRCVLEPMRILYGQ